MHAVRVQLLDRLVPLFVKVLPPHGDADHRPRSCLAHLDLSLSYDFLRLTPPAREAMGNFARPCINPSKPLPGGRSGSSANIQKAGSS